MDITLLENNFKLYQGCKWELFIYLIKQHCWEGYLGKLVNFLFGSISKKKINARSNFVSHVLHFWVLFCLAFNMHPSLKRIKKTTTKIIKCKQAHKMCCRFFCVSLALTHSNKAFGSKKKDYGEKSEKKKKLKKRILPDTRVTGRLQRSPWVFLHSKSQVVQVNPVFFDCRWAN